MTEVISGHFWFSLCLGNIILQNMHLFNPISTPDELLELTPKLRCGTVLVVQGFRIRVSTAKHVFDLWSGNLWSCMPHGVAKNKKVQHVCVYDKVKVTQSCLTLWDHMDYTVHGILQARILEWVAFPFSRGSSQPRYWTQVPHIAGRFSTSWATKQAQEQKSPTRMCIWHSESHSVMCDSLRPHGLYSPWNSPGQNTGVGSLSLLQWIFQPRNWTRVSCIVGGFFSSCKWQKR